MTLKEFGTAIFTLRARWTYLYVALIPFVNWTFAAIPTLSLPGGGMWTPVSIITGLILVVRDFAQREVGHWIFIPLLVAIGLSFATSDPTVVWASTAAFAISEIVDWAIYTWVKRPLSQRVVLSTAISAPLDSAVFYLIASLSIVGIFNIWTVGTSVLSKLLGVLVVFLILRERERRHALSPQG